jgi:hypothetical protein
MTKLFPVVVIFAGETLAILSEIIGAKSFGLNNNAFFKTFIQVIPIMLLGSVLLVAGYMLGLKNFKNIWAVSAISITSILIAEPIINFTITHQSPTRGAFIGLILGVLGFVAALFL